MSTTAAPVVAAPKVSFLKHMGQVIGKILGIVAKDAAPIAHQAAAVAGFLMPQFSGEIQFADSLVTKIAKQVIVTEAVAVAENNATSGAAKMDAVVAGIGPEIDAWVESMFPGAQQVSAASKAGLVQAVYNITNELKPSVAAPAGAGPTPALPAQPTPVPGQ